MNEEYKQQMLDLRYTIQVFNAQNESNYNGKLNADKDEFEIFNAKKQLIYTVDSVALFSEDVKFSLTKYDMKLLFNVMDNLF